LATTKEGTVVFYAVCSGNNGAAVFSMRSVPATIGQCKIEVFSLWSDHRLYKACYKVIIQFFGME
jgi:hypothetical protein